VTGYYGVDTSKCFACGVPLLIDPHRPALCRDCWRAGQPPAENPHEQCRRFSLLGPPRDMMFEFLFSKRDVSWDNIALRARCVLNLHHAGPCSFSIVGCL
jgi:hypothetical protein